MKPLNYYLSEVEAPPEVEEYFLQLDMDDKLYLGQMLCTYIDRADKNYEIRWKENISSYSKIKVEWLSQQSRDTWVRVLRWLAMEVI